MSSTTSTPAKRPRTDSLDNAIVQSPATPSSAARGQHRSPAIEGGHDANRAVNTSKVLATGLSNCKKELEAKDKIIAEKDAEIDDFKSQRKIHLEVISNLGGDELLAEALAAEESRNSSGASSMSDSSQKARKTAEKKQEKEQKEGEHEVDDNDVEEADTTA